MCDQYLNAPVQSGTTTWLSQWRYETQKVKTGSILAGSVLNFTLSDFTSSYLATFQISSLLNHEFWLTFFLYEQEFRIELFNLWLLLSMHFLDVSDCNNVFVVCSSNSYYHHLFLLV